jgi:hypothetical protein
MMQERFDAIRTMELARLDEMLAGIYEKALGGDLACVDRVLMISDPRARLLGLNVVQRFGSGDEFDAPPRSPSALAWGGRASIACWRRPARRRLTPCRWRCRATPASRCCRALARASSSAGRAEAGGVSGERVRSPPCNAISLSTKSAPTRPTTE